MAARVGGTEYAGAKEEAPEGAAAGPSAEALAQCPAVAFSALAPRWKLGLLGQ